MKRYLWLLILTPCFLLNLSLHAKKHRQHIHEKHILPTNSILEELTSLTPSEEGFVPVPFQKSLQVGRPPTHPTYLKNKELQLVNKAFETFCEKQESSFVSPNQSISKLIHFIWLGAPPPHHVEIAILSWVKFHPDWEIKLWTEKDLKDFTWSFPRSQVMFENGTSWAEKADIWRLEILYQYGGIYSDTDVICLKPFDELISTGLVFFSGLENNFIRNSKLPFVGNAVVGVAKNSPIIKKCLFYTKSEEEEPSLSLQFRSGPGPLTKAAHEALADGMENVVIFPCSYFYPLPWAKRSASMADIIKCVQPESFAIHLWEWSWAPTTDSAHE